MRHQPLTAEHAMARADPTAEWRSLLESQTRAALLAYAREMAIPGVSRLPKGALIETILLSPSPALAERIRAEAANRNNAAAPDPRLLLEACLEYGQHDRRAFIAPAIPRRRLEAAVAAIDLPVQERVLALFDNTPGGGGQFGIVIASRGIYWRNLRTCTGDRERGALSWRALQRAHLRVDDELGDVYAGASRINAQRLSTGHLLTLFARLKDAVPPASAPSVETPVITCMVEQAHARMRQRTFPTEAATLLAALLRMGVDRADDIDAFATEVAAALHLSQKAWSGAMETTLQQPDPLLHARVTAGAPGAHAVLWECLLALREAPPGDLRAQGGLDRLVAAVGITEAEWAQTLSIALQQETQSVPWLEVRNFADSAVSVPTLSTTTLEGACRGGPMLPLPALAALARALVILGMGSSLPTARVALLTPVGMARAVRFTDRTSRSVSTRTEFSFEPLGGSGSRLCLAVSGYLSADSEGALDWAPLRHFAVGAECYAVRWESQAIRTLGSQLLNVSLRSTGRALLRQIARQPVAVAAPGAVLPSLVLEYAHSIDRSWREAVVSSDAAAQQLAQHLRQEVPKGRSISLVGFSLGSRVIFRTLEELSRTRDEGIVSEVILLGGAFSASEDRWQSVRSVVSGRLVNAYCKNDYVLRYLYRAAEWERQIAGLLPAGTAGVEDIDLTEVAQGHLGYRRHLQRIMARIFGRDE